MYTFLIVIGLLVLVGHFFIEKEFFKRSLIVLSIIYFSGLAFIVYKDTTIIKKDAVTIKALATKLAIREKYEYISRLTPTGSDQELFYTVSPTEIFVPSGLPGILYGTYEQKKDENHLITYTYKCDEKSREKYQKAITFIPDFPFTYFALMSCDFKKGDPAWIPNAEKALEIFSITTTLPNHHRQHDEALRVLQEILKPVSTQ
ncbi:MAG: hypothetical protein Q8R26_03160 [bacterium]|nr:hypothetical protein [bacterium]